MVPPKHVLFIGGISSAASLADIIREFNKFGKCDCRFKVRGRTLRPKEKKHAKHLVELSVAVKRRVDAYDLGNLLRVSYMLGNACAGNVAISCAKPRMFRNANNTQTNMPEQMDIFHRSHGIRSCDYRRYSTVGNGLYNWQPPVLDWSVPKVLRRHIFTCGTFVYRFCEKHVT